MNTTKSISVPLVPTLRGIYAIRPESIFIHARDLNRRYGHLTRAQSRQRAEEMERALIYLTSDHDAEKEIDADLYPQIRHMTEVELRNMAAMLGRWSRRIMGKLLINAYCAGKIRPAARKPRKNKK